MDQFDTEKMTPFDKLISSSQLQMMKLMIPYTPPDSQRMIAILTKFLELEQTIEFFRHFDSDLHSQTFEKAISSPLDMLEELAPYLPEQLRASMDSILSIINMMQMASAMEHMASEGDGHSEAGTFNPMDMMQGMLTPEQQNMFEMYNTMFNETEDLDVKGEL